MKNLNTATTTHPRIALSTDQQERLTQQSTQSFTAFHCDTLSEGVDTSRLQSISRPAKLLVTLPQPNMKDVPSFDETRALLGIEVDQKESEKLQNIPKKSLPSTEKYGIIVSKVEAIMSNQTERENNMKNTNEATQASAQAIIESNIRRLKGGIEFHWDKVNPTGNTPIETDFTLKASNGLDKSALIVVFYSHEAACDLRTEGFTNIRVLVEAEDFKEEYKARFENNGGYSYEVMSNEAIADVKLVIGKSPFNHQDGAVIYPGLFKSFGKALVMLPDESSAFISAAAAHIEQLDGEYFAS